MYQMKEQDKTPEKQLNEMEIGTQNDNKTIQTNQKTEKKQKSNIKKPRKRPQV